MFSRAHFLAGGTGNEGAKVTDEQAIALVTNLVCQGRSLDPSLISPTTNLVDDLGFDSLDAAELLAALHKETGRQLNVDSIEGFQSVKDIARSLVVHADL
jgi:acyl carrier protein